jgi:hypothetical protein
MRARIAPADRPPELYSVHHRKAAHRLGREQDDAVRDREIVLDLDVLIPPDDVVV